MCMIVYFRKISGPNSVYVYLYFVQKSNALKPKGAVRLANYVVKKASEIKKDFAFKLEKYGQRTYYIVANSEEDMNR